MDTILTTTITFNVAVKICSFAYLGSTNINIIMLL